MVFAVSHNRLFTRPLGDSAGAWSNSTQTLLMQACESWVLINWELSVPLKQPFLHFFQRALLAVWAWLGCMEEAGGRWNLPATFFLPFGLGDG